MSPLYSMETRPPGLRERQAARIHTRSRCPGKKPCSGAFIGREAVSRKVPYAARPRGGRPKALECHSPGGGLLIFSTSTEAILHSRTSFAITALIERVAINLRGGAGLAASAGGGPLYSRRGGTLPRGRSRRIRRSIGMQQSCAPRRLSDRTRSADQPLSITALRMFLCPLEKPRRGVMLASPPCESLRARVHCGDQHYIGRKSHQPRG